MECSTLARAFALLGLLAITGIGGASAEQDNGQLQLKHLAEVRFLRGKIAKLQAKLRGVTRTANHATRSAVQATRRATAATRKTPKKGGTKRPKTGATKDVTTARCMALGRSMQKHYHREYKFLSPLIRADLNEHGSTAKRYATTQRRVRTLFDKKYGNGNGFFPLLKKFLETMFDMAKSFTTKMCTGFLFPNGWLKYQSKQEEQTMDLELGDSLKFIGKLAKGAKKLAKGAKKTVKKAGKSIKKGVTTAGKSVARKFIIKLLEKYNFLYRVAWMCEMSADLAGVKTKVKMHQNTAQKAKGQATLSFTRAGFFNSHNGQEHSEGFCQLKASIEFRECEGCCCPGYVDTSLKTKQQHPTNCKSTAKRAAKSRTKGKTRLGSSSRTMDLELGDSLKFIGKLAKGAKKLAKGAKKTVKKAGKSIKKGVKKAGKSIKKGTKKAGKSIKKVVKKAGKSAARKSGSKMAMLENCPEKCPTTKDGTCGHSKQGDGVDEARVNTLCPHSKGQSCERPMRCGKWVQMVEAILSSYMKMAGIVTAINQLGGAGSGNHCFDRSSSDDINACCKLANAPGRSAKTLREGLYLNKADLPPIMPNKGRKGKRV